MAQHGMLAGELCDFSGGSDQFPKLYFYFFHADLNRARTFNCSSILK